MTRMAMGFSLLAHVAAMLNGVVYSKQLPFSTVLMDSWYATQKLMAQIDQIEKLYSCPLKTNRRVDDSGGTAPYVRVNELQKRALRTCSKASASRFAAFPKTRR